MSKIIPCLSRMFVTAAWAVEARSVLVSDLLVRSKYMKAVLYFSNCVPRTSQVWASAKVGAINAIARVTQRIDFHFQFISTSTGSATAIAILSAGSDRIGAASWPSIETARRTVRLLLLCVNCEFTSVT
jgi:hypothetical protein